MSTDALILIGSMVGLCSLAAAAVTMRLPNRRWDDDLPEFRMSDWESDDYAWTCCICHHRNESDDCERCGCPAEVSYQIANRRSGDE